jgi:putative SOS response-associated peptidase YedK
MCGRFTNKLTWAEIVALYRLTTDRPPHNMRADHNVCPTDPVDAVVEHDGQRDLVQMRWGLAPYWWSKPLKELRAATFNARVETVETKPFFRDSFKRKRCLMPISGYYEWQDTPHGKQPWYFTARDGSPILTVAALWDEMEEQGNRRAPQIVRHDYHRTERLCRRGAQPYACAFEARTVRTLAERQHGCRGTEAGTKRLLAAMGCLQASE